MPVIELSFSNEFTLGNINSEKYKIIHLFKFECKKYFHMNTYVLYVITYIGDEWTYEHCVDVLGWLSMKLPVSLDTNKLLVLSSKISSFDLNIYTITLKNT